MAVIIVVIGVVAEGEPGRGADLGQRERAKNKSKCGQHFSATGGFVGLLTALRYFRTQIVTVFIEELSKSVRIGWPSQYVACYSKEKVRLTLCWS
ncbi:MAG: hypothetical protein M0Z45_03665 [Actinomycetota bacterium]|nr:hypothetical protein [Actinomycetota bacterium]